MIMIESTAILPTPLYLPLLFWGFAAVEIVFFVLETTAVAPDILGASKGGGLTTLLLFTRDAVFMDGLSAVFMVLLPRPFELVDTMNGRGRACNAGGAAAGAATTTAGAGCGAATGTTRGAAGFGAATAAGGAAAARTASTLGATTAAVAAIGFTTGDAAAVGVAA